MRANEFVREDAAGVGVIAGKKQANDPRYKTSLTVDVKPDTMKKAIAAYFPTEPLDSRQKQVHESSNDPVAVDSTSPINGDEELDEEALNEIERLTRSDYVGGKDYLYAARSPKKFFPLPGGSGLVYNISGSGSEPTIAIWDPNAVGTSQPPRKEPYEFNSEYQARLRQWEKMQSRGKNQPQIIGKLTLEKPWRFPLANALQVGTITVDEDYRGVGIAKALYGIVLTILRRPLVAGSSQTPGGRRNWVSLAGIPGVEMKGYIGIDDSDINVDPNPSDRWDQNRNKQAEQKIDIIMGRLGGQYIGKGLGKSTRHFFAFDVKPTTDGKELEAYVKQNLAKVYGERYDMVTGLYAVWTGQ